jgi:hypothetical protein
VRLFKRLFSAVAVTVALLVATSTTAYADWNTAEGPSSTAFCSGTYTTIPALRFRECIYTSSVTGGAWVSSALIVTNITSTPRWVAGFTETVVGGRVQPRTDCGQLKLAAYTTARCTEGGRRFVLDGSYAYGRGWVKDFSSGMSSWAYSPVYRP